MTEDDSFKARMEVRNRRRRELYAERKKIQRVGTFRQTRPEFLHEAEVNLSYKSSGSGEIGEHSCFCS